jgi:hypothetical protein
MAATQTERQHAPERIRRVVPAIVNSNVVLSVDTDRHGGKWTGRRTSSDLAFDVGAFDGSFVASPHGKESPTKLARLDVDNPLESLRVVPSGDKRVYAFAFKQGSALVFGDSTFDGPGATRVHRIETGHALGAPSIAASQGTVVVAWAERVSETDPWMLSLATFQAGKREHAMVDFSLPPGGLGQRAIAPSISAFKSGFLLSWTEGPQKSSQVRAQLYDLTMHAVGDPVTLSEPLRNAGQSQAVVRDDGHGAAAFFLESKTKAAAFSVVAVALVCQPS